MLKKIDNEIFKRVIRALVYGAGGAILSKAILLISNIVVARILNSREYGTYSLLNNTIQTFAMFAGAGIGVTLTRYTATFREKNKKLAGILIMTLSYINLIMSLLISVLIFILSEKLSIILGAKIDISLFLKITAFTVFFTSLNLLWQSVLQGFEKYKHVAIIQAISHILFFIISFILTKFIGILGAIIALFVLQIISYILMHITTKRIIKDNNIKLKFIIDHNVKDAILNFSIPAFLSSIFILPLLLVINFWFTKTWGYESFAAFSVCLQWLTIINYLPQQVAQVKPIYTQLYEEKKYYDFIKLVKKMTILSFCIAVVIAIVVIVFNQFVLGIYGDNYKEYSNPFIIMIITSIFIAVQSQFGSVFQAMGMIWKCFFLNLLWAVIFIIVFSILNKYSVLGYTYTYLISYIIYSIVSVVLFYIDIKKHLHIKEK